MGKCKVKICGLTRPQDIEVVNELLPEYIGFVFWEHSKRNVIPENAAKLRAKLAPGIKVVGVFVDADIDFILGLVKCGTIDIAQLHGNEDEQYIRSLHEKLKAEKNCPDDTKIIKAFNINKVSSFDEIEESSADYVMLDPGKGDGITFDWDKAKNIRRPYFLAGGLSPENVREVVEQIGPYAVDVSSGVETDGVKDRDKIINFVHRCRG